MENIINEFRKIAPYIAANVKAANTESMSDAETMQVIKSEITDYFNKQYQMFMEYLRFDDIQRAAFAEVMYSVLAPLAKPADVIEAAHAEALAMDAAYEARRIAYSHQIAFYCKTPAYQRKLIEWLHEEALMQDTARIAHQRRAAQRVAAIMGKAPA